MATHIIAVYKVDLAYGGPEEGGWWYEVGSLVRVVRAGRSHARVLRYYQRLNGRLRSREFGPNKGRRSISCVLSAGEYCAQLHTDGCPPQSYPATRPRYE